MADVIKIKEYDDKQVIVEINAKDPLTVAKHPFLNSNMKYITVTRGKEHVFTVINEDGSTWSFHFGESGYTLIGEETERLKQFVLKFIADNNILIGYDGGTPISAEIFYNGNFDVWQLALRTKKGDVMRWAKDATNVNEAIAEFSCIVEADNWEKGVAQTGIDIWNAKNPKFNLV